MIFIFITGIGIGVLWGETAQGKQKLKEKLLQKLKMKKDLQFIIIIVKKLRYKFRKLRKYSNIKKVNQNR